MIRKTLVALSASAALLLTGCGADPAPASTTDPAKALTISDAWVKAADKDMTAIFGVLANSGGEDLQVVAAETDISPVELHEVVTSGGETKMRPIEGGFTVAADGEHELEPGGDHLMLMDLSRPIKPGDEVAFTLILADDTEVELTAVAKEFGGGNESYDDGKGED